MCLVAAAASADEYDQEEDEMKPFFSVHSFYYISHRILLRKRTILIQFLIFNVFSCRSVFEWKIKCRYNCVNFDKSRSKYIALSLSLLARCYSIGFCLYKRKKNKTHTKRPYRL